MKYIHEIQLQKISEETERFESDILTEVEIQSFDSQEPDLGIITIEGTSFYIGDLRKIMNNFKALCRADTY